MGAESSTFSRLDAKRREQTPQALARLVVVALFIGLWFVLWLARIPMPVPFLLVLVVEVLFFLLYLRAVAVLPTARAVQAANYCMLAAEIVFHTTIVYFLGGISWLGAFAYVFGLIFTNTFLDLGRGLVYTVGASAAFATLVALEATGVVPHYVYLEQGPLRFEDPRFVVTTLVGGIGVFFSVDLWVNWVGRQLRHERDAAVHAQEELLRGQAELESYVSLRTSQLEESNAALCESEARLRTVINNSAVVLLSLNVDGVFTLLEGKGLEGLAVTSEEVLGRSVFDVFRNSPPVLEAVRKALSGEEATTVARTARLTYEARLVPVRDADGAVTGVIGVATDVTERKQAEEALRESEGLLRMVVGNADVILFAMDAEGTFTLSDGRGVQTMNRQPGELVGKSVFDVYRDAPDVLSNVRRALAGEAFAESVTAGSRVFETHYTPTFDSAGSLSGVIGVASDITERRRAEEALRESEERFRRLADNAPDIIFRFRSQPTGAFEYISPAVVPILGYTQEEFYADPQLGSRILHPDDRAALLSVISENRSEPAVFRWIAKDGSIVWLESRTVVLHDHEGNRLAIEGIARDITERKRVEEALRESEGRFRRLAENAVDVIFRYRFQPECAYEYISPAVTELVGYTPEEFYADPDLDTKTVHPDDLEQLWRVIAEGPKEPTVLRWFKKDGGLVWLEIRSVHIYDDAGELLAIEGIARDVTERKRWEEALRESETKFRTMAETVAAAAFIFQGEGMRYVNSAAERMTGYSRDELLAMSFWEMIHPDFRDLVKERGLARQRGETVPQGYEVKIVTKTGETKWVDFTAGAVDFEGAPAVLGTAFDITERKVAESALQEAASRDHLTGLLNRRAGLAAIEAQLEEARSDGRRVAVLVLDLDRFKKINDSFSHEAGDTALRRFAGVLNDVVGKDGTICRLGGDEFQIARQNADMEQATALAEELQDRLRGSFRERGSEMLPRFTVSIGVACFPQDGDGIEALGRHADEAMYAAKAAGGDRSRAWRELPRRAA